MNTGAELVQYFVCIHTIKNIQWRLNTFNSLWVHQRAEHAVRRRSVIVQSVDIWFNHCNRTNGEAVNKETRQRPGTLERAGSSTRCDPAHFKPWG